MFFCEKNFNPETTELVGIFIKNFRCFQNQFFSLHPQIKGNVCKEKNEFTFLFHDNKEYDLFREKKINVTTLCGKNGCGKSTIINLIRNYQDKSNACILFFIDDKGCMAASEKIDIKYENRPCNLIHEEKNFSIIFNDRTVVKDKPNFHFQTDAIERYLEAPGLFSFENDGELYTHYEIRLDISNIISYLIHSFDNDDEHEEPYYFDSLETDYPLYFLIAEEMRNKGELNSFLISKKIKSFNNFFNHVDHKYPSIKKHNSELRDILYSTDDSDVIRFETPYRINKFSTLQAFKNEKNKLFSFLYNTLQTITDHPFVDFIDNFTFIPLKIMRNGKRYFEDLSEGQKSSLKNRDKIYTYLEHIDKGFIIPFDEPENNYHPEMARHFWANLVDDITFTKEYILKTKINEAEKNPKTNKKIQMLNTKFLTIIASTHNPFLLSDLFNHNILALNNDENGFAREVKIKNTFAGNITEILCDSMFMNGTTGVFAEKQIEALLQASPPNKMNQENKSQLVEQIGDPILKNILRRWLNK